MNTTIRTGNEVIMQYFHWYLPNSCDLWAKLCNEAKILNNIGITAVWLPPAYKGAYGVNDVGYSVYDLYDLGEFNQKGTIPTKYGTKDEYIRAIKVLHENNIYVYADVSFEHRIGADYCEDVEVVEVEYNNRNIIKSTPQNILAWTKFTFPGRNNKYSSFIWEKSCFHAVDYDERTKKNSIFKFKDKEWDNCVDLENGNYDYLMGADVDFSNDTVVTELDHWGEWYVDITDIDGFRLDAVKHMQCLEINHWLKNIREKKHKNFFAVGEYWSNKVELLIRYLAIESWSLSLFDVPLHYNFHNASCSNGSYDMRNLLKGTLIELSPSNAVTFVDNHDTQKGQSLESYVYSWFKPIAYSVILLRRQGYPCVFYADYYSGDSNNTSISLREILDVLLRIRRDKAYGIQHDYFDHCDVVGWTREGHESYKDSGLAVVATNRLGGYKDMYVGKHFANKVFYDALGNRSDKVIINQQGNGKFLVNNGSVSVWVKEEI